MLEKAKQAVDDLKNDMEQKKLKKTYNRKMRELEENRLEEERIRDEQEEIQKEYDRLTSLSDKQLMVELIFAMRGFYSQVEELYSENCMISDKIEELESDIHCLKAQMHTNNSNR